MQYPIKTAMHHGKGKTSKKEEESQQNMASKALKRTTRAVQYFPNLRAMVNQTKVCAGAQAGLSTSTGPVNYKDKPVLFQTWPDQALGPFGPKDPRFPLPGNVGVPLGDKHITADSTKPLVDAFLEIQSETHRKEEVLASYLSNLHADVPSSTEHATLEQPLVVHEEPGTVESSVQACPAFLHKGFMELFPDKNIQAGKLTVISISQHSKNDMSVWSLDVEEEREELMKNFVESAKEICNNLMAAGYWADFIDPSSGTSFFGPHTNTTLFETDERFNHLGFNVMDLGCCKVISHHLWGTYAFIGSLFTNAPADSEILGKTLQHQ